MKRWIPLALAAIGCAHPHDAEVVSSVQTRSTIGTPFTADTTRLVPNAAATANEEGEKRLAELIDRQLAAVGQLRADKPIKNADGTTTLELAADLPAPGWALRARIQPKPEQMCFVLLEPIATQPDEHPVTTAPWSVQDAFEAVRTRAVALLEPKLPPMDPARFARLRAEAADAAAHGIDPLLSPSDYVRVPRPINRDGADMPYYVPPIQQQQQ